MHLVNYEWYLDYSKDNAPASEFSLREKKKVGFQEILQTFTSTQMQKGEKKGFALGKRSIVMRLESINELNPIGKFAWM